MEQPTPIPESKDLYHLLEELNRARADSLAAVARISIDALDASTQIRDKTLRQMCHTWIDHYRNHAVQLSDLRAELNDRPDEIARLIEQSYATFGFVVAQLMTTHSKDFERAPSQDQWTILEIVQHLLEFERRYSAEFARLASSTHSETAGSK